MTYTTALVSSSLCRMSISRATSLARIPAVDLLTSCSPCMSIINNPSIILMHTLLLELLNHRSYNACCTLKANMLKLMAQHTCPPQSPKTVFCQHCWLWLKPQLSCMASVYADDIHAWPVSRASAAAMRACSMSGLVVDCPCPASLLGLCVESCSTRLSKESEEGWLLIAASTAHVHHIGTTSSSWFLLHTYCRIQLQH